MEWPYRRFLKAYAAFQRRTTCEQWRDRKHQHVSAMYANTNWDDEKNNRSQAIEKIEKSYDKIIARMWSGEDFVDKEEEAEQEVWESPLMRAGRKAVNAIRPPSMPGQAAIEALPTG